MMLLNKAKTSLFVVAVVTVFFIISWVAGVRSISTVTLKADDRSVEVSPDNAPVVLDHVVAQPQPFMGETLYKASLNWADYVEEDARKPMVSKPFMGQTINEASLNWADYQKDTVDSGFIGKTLYESSLNWADFAETAVSKAKPSRPFMGDTIQQASRNWADFSDENISEGTLPMPALNSVNNNKPY